MTFLRYVLRFFSAWSPVQPPRDGGPATSRPSFHAVSKRYQLPPHSVSFFSWWWWWWCGRHRKRPSEDSRAELDELRQRNALLACANAALERDVAALRGELERVRRSRDECVETSEKLRHQKAELDRALAEAHELVRAQDEDAALLREDNAALHAAWVEADDERREQAAEMQTMQVYLDKTDGWTGQQVVQAVADLNTEIVQLSALIADEFAPSFDRAVKPMNSSHRALISKALGEDVAKLLSERDHREDPTLVQFAIQAWEVHLCAQVFEAFCYGAAPEINDFLSQVFEQMHKSEPQPTSSRWRALAHSHARHVYPTTGAGYDEATQPDTHLRGVQAILALAGCAASRPALHARFGDALGRVCSRAGALARVLAEEVMSANYEVVGAVREADDDAGSAHDSGFGEDEDEDVSDAVVFCAETMHDVFEGAAQVEHARVVCVTELGLTCVRRRDPAPPRDYDCDAGEIPELGGREEEDLIERMVFLKPKVLLDSALSLL